MYCILPYAIFAVMLGLGLGLACQGLV